MLLLNKNMLNDFQLCMITEAANICNCFCITFKFLIIINLRAYPKIRKNYSLLTTLFKCDLYPEEEERDVITKLS